MKHCPKCKRNWKVKGDQRCPYCNVLLVSGASEAQPLQAVSLQRLVGSTKSGSVRTWIVTRTIKEKFSVEAISRSEAFDMVCFHGNPFSVEIQSETARLAASSTDAGPRGQRAIPANDKLCHAAESERGAQ